MEQKWGASCYAYESKRNAICTEALLATPRLGIKGSS
jgi:hypothetical protein